MSGQSPKPPKRITATRLRNVAIAYVRRYGGATVRLRSVLERRVARSLQHHGELERQAECAALINELLERLLAEGILDDGREARMEALRHTLSGRPQRVIAQRLRAKGFPAEVVQQALAGLKLQSTEQAGYDPDWLACCRFARRRRLGPFRRPDQEEQRERDLRCLTRAGFAFRWALRVVDTQERAELEAVLDEAPGLLLASPEPLG